MEETKPVRGCGPPPKYGSQTVVRGVRMPDDLWKQLTARAKKKDTTRNELIIRTLQRSIAAAGGK